MAEFPFHWENLSPACSCSKVNFWPWVSSIFFGEVFPTPEFPNSVCWYTFICMYISECPPIQLLLYTVVRFSFNPQAVLSLLSFNLQVVFFLTNVVHPNHQAVFPLFTVFHSYLQDLFPLYVWSALTLLAVFPPTTVFHSYLQAFFPLICVVRSYSWLSSLLQLFSTLISKLSSLLQYMCSPLLLLAVFPPTTVFHSYLQAFFPLTVYV